MTAVVRGSFEYQGQKCSAASRIYIPESLWGEMRDELADRVSELKVGDVTDFENFMGAVIDANAFATHKEALDEAQSNGRTIVAGGTADDSEGFFVQPTVIETSDPGDRLLREELFGPIVTAYVYPDTKWDETLDARRLDLPVRADRCRLRARPCGHRRRRRQAPVRGGQLLRQRQADRRGRRPAAVRRRRGRRARTTRPARCGT